MKRFIHVLRLAIAVALIQAPVAAQACGVCMGQSDGSKVGEAMNGAIFVMLGFIGAMLAGITAVGITIVRRAHTPLPEHMQLAEMIGSQTTK